MEHQGFRPIVSPDVPVPVRRALTGAGVWHSLASAPRSGPREWHPAKAIGVVLSVAIGAGGVLGGLLALMIWATSADTRDPAPAAALWGLGLGPAVLAALVSIPALWLMIRNWRTERLALRWWGYGIPAARQAAAAFDAELAHLRSIVGTADEIVQVLDDLALAERLGSGAPTAQQLREQFTSAPTDLAAMAAAAREAAALVRQALDPNRLYPAD